VVLVDAFTAAGAESVTNSQANGTVIFWAADPGEVVERVQPLLLAATGHEDVVVVRSHAWLAELGSRRYSARQQSHPDPDAGGPVTCRGIPTMIRLATRL
jgi:uncharacterized protein (DUF1697 family)